MEGDRLLRLLSGSFAALGLTWSSVYLHPLWGPVTSLADLALQLVALSPIALAAMAVAGAIFDRLTLAALSVNTVVWLALGAGEVVEGPPYEDAVLGFAALFLSIAAFIVLVRRAV